MRVFQVAWKWNVPNALSLLRLALVPLFAVLYLCRWDALAFATLLLSGVTDVLDGFLARKLNQITECGKLMDPLADKLTQVTVVVCLTTRYPEIFPLTVICFAKELCQGIGGLILLNKKAMVKGSKWFGKAATVLFYVCMLILVLWHDEMKTWMIIGVVFLACVTMIGAFIGYLREYIRMRRDEAQPEKG